jgi:hypothetical protein
LHPLLAHLIPEQCAAVEATEYPLLILASASFDEELIKGKRKTLKPVS